MNNRDCGLVILVVVHYNRQNIGTKIRKRKIEIRWKTN